MGSKPTGSPKKRLGKRLWTSNAARVLLVLLMRGWRWFGWGTALNRTDPRLLEILRSDEAVIFAVWHQDFPHTLAYLSRWNARRKTYPLASASRDGTLAAAVAEGMGYRRAIRGSSARGGHRALLSLTRLVQSEPDASVAVVVDGPRPPARVLQPGIIHLAQASGRPIWLVRSSWRWTKVLARTWARFHLPLPGTAGVILTDGPIHIPANLDRAGLEAARKRVEDRMNALADRADRAVGRAPDPR